MFKKCKGLIDLNLNYITVTQNLKKKSSILDE